jgi:LysR family transcriptional regulator, low CO2-responsive transcriptional regulator
VTNLHQPFISSQKLYIFSQVVKFKSITAAANHLHMTQPAISNIIKQLEKHFACSLVEIVGKRLQLTPAGKTLYQEWQNIHADYELLYQHMESLKKGLSGRIHIAMVSTGKYFIPSMIANFLKQFPHVDFACDILPREKIIDALAEQKCNIGILTDAAIDDRFDTFALGDNPLVFIAHPEHPLAKQTELTFNDLCSASFIIREPTAVIGKYLLNLFQSHGAKPQCLFEIYSTEAIKQSVMQNLGIALVPNMSIVREVAHGDLCILNLKKIKLVNQWHMLVRRQRYQSQLIKNFCHLARCQTALQ